MKRKGYIARMLELYNMAPLGGNPADFNGFAVERGLVTVRNRPQEPSTDAD